MYQLTDDLVIIQTLDFFPSMVSNPYHFGMIAATNALSDIYAMGGEVKTALNIVAYPKGESYENLHEILRGGAEKVQEAGAVLAGGHSIHDETAKYGLSVLGTAHPDSIIRNDNSQVGDRLILTKKLGTGIIATASRNGKASESAYQAALKQMITLNKYAAEQMKAFKVNSCTDITGFGLLGHLTEMLTDQVSCDIDASQIGYLPEAYQCAESLFITGGGQRNRQFVGDKVAFTFEDKAIEELLFDPQTSGGLLMSVPSEQAPELLQALLDNDIEAFDIGQVVEKRRTRITVTK